MIAEAVEFLKSRTALRPRVAVVLGSGLGAFADELAERIEIPYARDSRLARSTAIGHAGKLVFGKLGALEVAVMAGRVHLYEGYTPAQVTYRRARARIARRALHRLHQRRRRHQPRTQARRTGADFRSHQSARIESAGRPERRRTGPALSRHVAKPIRRDLRARLGHDVASEMGIELQRRRLRGTARARAMRPPPKSATSAPSARTWSACPPVPEVIVANHMGMRVLAISCVTNMAAGILPQKIDHAEVLEAGEMVRGTLVRSAAKPLLPQDAEN